MNFMILDWISRNKANLSYSIPYWLYPSVLFYIQARLFDIVQKIGRIERTASTDSVSMVVPKSSDTEAEQKN